MNNGRLRDDSRPIRALAAAVVLDAVKALKDTRTDEAHLLIREQAALFFTREDRGETPCNLSWCCQILELDPKAIRDRLHVLDARRINGAMRAVGQLRRDDD